MIFAILLAAAAPNQLPPKCPIANPPYTAVGKVCWDGVNVWSSRGYRHPIKKRVTRDSDTRPKDGDAKQGSTRE